MIAHLAGRLAVKSPTEIVVDVQGVGYQLFVSLSTSEQLGTIGDDVRVLTYMHVREDAMQLFGFAKEAERELFKMLINVSGIGPKMAQGILSGLTPEDLRAAILQGNLLALTAISGIGRKTAERLVLELRDKIGKMRESEPIAVEGSQQMKARAEAVIALMSLGYTRVNAEKAIRDVLSETSERDFSVEELLKRALRHATR
jgi:Holliday junction DNA helicase RuvA